MINDGARTDLGLEKVACLWAVGGGEMIGDTFLSVGPEINPAPCMVKVVSRFKLGIESPVVEAFDELTARSRSARDQGQL